MNKNIVTMILLLLSAKACSLQGNTCVESLTGSRSEEKDANSVEAILTQLKQKTTNLTSYQAELEYRFKQPLLESETLRKGALYYQKSDEKSMLRVNFQTLKQDDEKERKYSEHFIFDGVWLTRIDYQIKKAERRQMTSMDIFFSDTNNKA